MILRVHLNAQVDVQVEHIFHNNVAMMSMSRTMTERMPLNRVVNTFFDFLMRFCWCLVNKNSSLIHLKSVQSV